MRILIDADEVYPFYLYREYNGEFDPSKEPGAVKEISQEDYDRLEKVSQELEWAQNFLKDLWVL